MKHDVLHIANRIILNTDTEHGELISNLKLQKLLYYMQGYFIAIFDRKLFENDIEAWQYGPVVSETYNHFKGFGRASITLEAGAETANLNAEEQKLFDEVLSEYTQYSAIKLMNMTHEESPWMSAFNSNPKGLITKKLLSDYFKTMIVE